MIALLTDALSWFCFLGGSFFCISGGVGLLRFPDFYSRVHATSVTETLGMPLILLGVILQVGLSLDALKLFLILIFVMLTNPTAAHAMAKAALHGGQSPVIGSNARQAED